MFASTSAILRGACGLLAGVVVAAATATAQEPPAQAPDTAPPPLAALAATLRPGERLEVVSRDGTAVTGRLTGMSETSLVLNIRGRAVEVPTEKIREVSRLGDPIGNGIARGMGIGALAGLPIMLMGDRSAYPSESTMPLALGLSLYGAGIGAALGAVFDAAFERRFVVFRTQVQGVSVVPILARDRTGLAVTWRF